MALAATLAATGARPASFLPTITCSHCAQEIEIAAMGEHICGPEITEAIVRKSRSSICNPLKLREYGASGHGNSSLGRAENTGMSEKPRAPMKQSRILPKINSDAANRAFLAPRNPGLQTPLTPGASLHSDINGGKLYPGMMNPKSRMYGTSPELTANLDCAFPPFPTQAMASGRSTPSNGCGTSTGSDRAPSRAASRAQNLEPAPTLAEPKSPGLVSQKFETLRTGPFTARRQGSGDSREEVDVYDETLPSPGAAEEHLASPNHWDTQSALGRLDTASMEQVASGGTEATKKTPPPRPARLSYEQLSPVLLERFSAEPDSIVPPLELRSEPALRFPPRKASLANIDVSQISMASDLDNPPPRRSSSRVGTRIDPRMENAPPVPRPIQQHRNHSNHTPSESGSSTVSSANTYSSGPSPISSVASSVDPFSPLSSAMGAEDEETRPAGSNRRIQQTPGIRAELPSHRSPPRKFGRPAPPAESSSKVDRMNVTLTEIPRPSAPHGSQQPMNPDASRTGLRPAQMTPTGSQLEAQTTPSPNVCDDGPRGGPNISASAASVPQRPSRPTIAKPMCRGCGFVIEGKSVKAADGRLTGRWHKPCFVCTTCEKPFATADFYVIGNQPYCEHHYHEKNGSLCNGCHRGIEGQYLETTSTTRTGTSDKKFHPRCFTCATCHEVLSEDYFEVAGMGALCERHALATLRQQQIRNGSRSHALGRRDMFAERRTTRLINPMMA